MQRKRYRIRLVMVCVLGVLVLGACGKSDEPKQAEKLLIYLEMNNDMTKL